MPEGGKKPVQLPPTTPLAEGQRKSGINDVLVDHADRLWQAAVEDASRLANRGQLIAGAMIALLGLGFFSFVWLQQTPVIPMCAWWVTTIIHLLLIAAVLHFAFSLARLYYRPNPTNYRASDLMEINQDADIGRSIRWLVFWKTYNAYLDLASRNDRERKELRRGQELFSRGVGLLLLSVLIYLAGSLPAKIYPEALNYEQDRQQSDQAKSTRPRSAAQANRSRDAEASRGHAVVAR